MTTKKLSVSDPERLASVQKLCEYPRPYSFGSEQEDLFVRAMAENITWHSERLEFYRRLLEEKKFSISSLKSIRDCAGVPFIHANFFKLHEVLSVRREEVSLHLTSSGTSGQKSQIFFDEWSIGSGHRMVDFMFQENGWVTEESKTNYLLFNYEPYSGFKVGTSFTANFLCKYAPASSVFYALRNTGDGGHEFDPFGTIETVRRYADEGLPVRIFGFPSFMYFTLRRMRELNVPDVKLSEKSLVFFGGGWKGYADKAISKKELYGMITEQLGIPDGRIRDGYGSVEHSVPYVECRGHNFHVPVWSRVYIRDVKTLDPLEYGREGFLQFLSPYITSVPAQSVLMGDMAVMRPGGECTCGITTPFFSILGRAGTSKNKSCALAAAEMLKDGS